MRRSTVAWVAALLLGASAVVPLAAGDALDPCTTGPPAGRTALARSGAPGPRAAAVLPPLRPPPAVASPRTVAGALTPLLATSALRGAGAAVLDTATDALLFQRSSTAAHIPASLVKLVTAASVLTTLGPDARLHTRVMRGPAADELVLVGAGDPTLIGRREARGSYPLHGSLMVLADRTAAALATTGVSSVRLRIDDALFVGSAFAPGWARSYRPAGVVAPVSALSVDGGRAVAGRDQRVADPALAAGRSFAALLARHGVLVRGTVRRAARGATATSAEVAAVDSPTVGVLVEEMLERSDNDIAEALARLAAAASGRPASFAGGAAAAVETLTRLRVPTGGSRLLDGSGLARGSRLSPATLVRLLDAAAGAGRPRLRTILTGLAVAGLSGTLAERFAAPASRRAAGAVRAKTGTLTGVSSLAGTAYDADGRLLAFAVMADAVPAGATRSARDALDRLAATVATCRCSVTQR